MIRTLALVVLLSGCSAGALKTEAPSTSTVYRGTVVSATEVEFDGNESKTARFALAGIPGLITEDLSVSGTRYEIRVESGLIYSVESHSIIETGACVQVEEFSDGDYPILRECKE